VQFEGSFVRLEGWRLAVTPARPGGPLVWLGGSHPTALRRAVRIGDGWIGAGSSTTEDFAAHVRRIRDELAESGRDAASFPVGKRAYLAVGRREANERRRLRDWFGRYHEHPEVADRVGLVGTPEVVAERLIELRAAGARVLILNPLFAEERQLAVLAADVVPMIREARI
jgi:alkanesulfonate monooxygenase SsuD/methylene tetrahydromethanopterin reductase-like flavin-dependent oxidoreductase (luciferase family)